MQGCVWSNTRVATGIMPSMITAGHRTLGYFRSIITTGAERET